MIKKLVKRSRFTKIAVTTDAPVTLLVEGDEAYISFAIVQPPDTTIGGVKFERQIERELYKQVGPEGYQSPVLLQEDWKRVSLGVRFANYANFEAPEVNQDEANLLCGFSDHVTFSTVYGSGTAIIVLETVHYEERN
jgi:hypothetical protein